MKKYIIILLAGFIIINFSSCTKKFDEINTNPNNPDVAPMTNVFAYTIESLSQRYGTAEIEYPASYVGYVTKGNYIDVVNYQTPPTTSIWDGVYQYIVTNSNFVIEEADQVGNQNLKAAATIIKIYAMQLVTDAYGKVPYSEAGMGSEGIVYPAYDTEQEIYYDMMQKLDEANDLLNSDPTNGLLGSDDILYAGNVDRWKKFCNSLHLRLAIRISNVDENKASTEIAKIFNNPSKYPIFESNFENAKISFPGGDWQEPWYNFHTSIGVERVAKPIIDTLVNYIDPRISHYADTIADGTYNGLEVGLEWDNQNANSMLNSNFISETGSVFFLKYAEIEFIKAEAIKRGFISGDAQAAYEAGITASCKEYFISDADITTYLAGPDVAWNDDLNQIYIQKWIALFRQSWEAWAEMRRTDIPTLPPAAGSIYTGHNRPPFRFSYPDSEVMLNSENVPSDVTETDQYWGYQVWWDTRTGVQ